MSPTVDMNTLDQAMKMWTWAQFGCGRAIADLVNNKVIPLSMADALLIRLQVFTHPSANDDEAIMQTQYGATYNAVKATILNTQTAERMLEKRLKTVHPLCTIGGDTITSQRVEDLISEIRTK